MAVLWCVLGLLFSCYLFQSQACDVPIYADIDPVKPTKVFDVPNAHGICVQESTGNFLVTNSVSPTMYLFHHNGFLMKIISAPKGAVRLDFCTYTPTAIYVTDSSNKTIYQFDTDGAFNKVFATGKSFYDIEFINQVLYISLKENKFVLIYTIDGIHRHTLETYGIVNGLASDDRGYCYTVFKDGITVLNTAGRVAKHVTNNELKKQKLIGITVDKCRATVVADSKSIHAYTPKSILLKTLQGPYEMITDVGISKGALLVADYKAGKVYFYKTNE